MGNIFNKLSVAIPLRLFIKNCLIPPYMFIICVKLLLNDVSLIIFDECHRAVGDYAYCFIAKKYINNSNHPQILGLTASPGSTEEKINEIKDNLFINLKIRE